MSKSPVALIGPTGLPELSEDTLWCPRLLRERAWSEWRARGLPSKGVEDYLYMDWKRLESVARVPDQPSASSKDASESAQINLRTASASEFGSGKGCSVKLLSDATTEVQTEVAKQLERLVDRAEHTSRRSR